MGRGLSSATIAPVAVASPADVLIAAVVRELEARRDEIESDAGLRTVTVVCRLNRSTRLPRAVIVTRESEQDYSAPA